MRVGLVCPYDWETPGGVQAHVRDLARVLMHHGHEVSVLAPADDDAELPSWVVGAGRTVAVPYNGSVARLNFGVGTTRRVRRWVREGGFDLLHVHEPTAPGLSLLACWVASGPIVATFHTSNPRSRAMSVASAMLQTALEKVTARIAVSEAARQTLVEHLGGDAVVIPNGVPVDVFTPPSPAPDPPTDGGRVLFLGRIDEARKGLPVLLAALPALLARRPGLRVTVAGPGDADDVAARLDPRVRAAIDFVGLLDEQTKIETYRSADVYVAPHTGKESFGIVLLEAMAARTAVVASDLDAFRRVLDDGRCGVMVPVGDPAALADAVGDLLDDRPRRRLLEAAGAARAAEFDWDTVVLRILDVYASVAAAGGPVSEDLRGQLMGRLTRLGFGGRGDDS